MKSNGKPREVYVAVSGDLLFGGPQTLGILQGFGTVVAIEPEGGVYSDQWRVYLENPSWPPGPDGAATAMVHRHVDGLTVTVKTEITLPR
jgi:hypothetical protein